MFEFYGARWHGLLRWWRRTPPAAKIFGPIIFVALMLLPFELSSLLGGVTDTGEDGKASSRRPYPTDFGSTPDA
jgi:hypothetical protein